MKKIGTLAERTCKQPGLPGTQPANSAYAVNRAADLRRWVKVNEKNNLIPCGHGGHDNLCGG
jgi:hypothetical protein